MAGRFVRASKYRHVFGRPTRREQCYDNLRVSKNAWDTNLIKVNPKYLAVNWEASGGGAFAVIPIDEKGKLPETLPLCRGHTATVLDVDWSPFDDDIIASGSDDGKVFLWKIPEGFTLYSDAEEPEDIKPVGKLSGHSRKVGHVLFNPAAENVLASSSGDFTVKLWDLEDGKSKLTLKHNDIVQSLSWSADGATLVTTSRDKKIRFWDVRQEKPAHEVAGHTGAKNSRCIWMGEHDRVLTTGFSKMSERQIGLWDVRNPNSPINGFESLDSSSGVGMPFWDEGTQMLYIAGKGDGNIKYFEFENDKLEFLSEYRSPDPQRGFAFMPKRGINTHENEVMRAFKSVNDQYIEPISFIVPRRSETFQDDIYAPTTGLKPGVSSGEWFTGKTAVPPKFSMEDLYNGQELHFVAGDDKPKPKPAPPAAQSEIKAEATPKSSQPVNAHPEPKVAVAPIAAAREVPSVNDQKKSMADAASRFADKEDVEDDDDDSSFEEIQRPVERPKSQAPAASTPPSHTQAAAPAQPSISKSIPSATTSNGQVAAKTSEPASVASSTPTPTSQPSAVASAAGGLKDVLQEIRNMLQSQSQQIAQLTEEVSQLKAKLSQ